MPGRQYITNLLKFGYRKSFLHDGWAHHVDWKGNGREMMNKSDVAKVMAGGKPAEASNSRTVYFDFLRIIAIFAVVVLHVSAKNFYGAKADTLEWQAFNFYDSIVRWGVPVFVMISGALFLNGEHTIGKLYKKNVLRIIVAFVFWSMLYALNNMIHHHSGWKATLKQFLAGEGHMWFLFMIVGLYIIVPLVKPIVQSMELTKYFLLLSLIFTFAIPQAIKLVSLKYPGAGSFVNVVWNKVSFHFTLGYVGYFVLGYYLSKTELSRKVKRIIYFLSACGCFATIIGSSAISVSQQKPNAILYDDLGVNVMLEALGVFVFVKDRFAGKDVSGKAVRILGLLAKYSFGAYLVHILVLNELKRIFGLDTLSFSPVFSVPVISVIVLVISFVISAVLNHIPLLKKTV